MEENTIRKIKWFWPWQDEQEEAWLRNMSQKGWHLSSVGLPCIYRFRAGEQRDYVYRLDYQTFPKKDKQEYQQLFRDAGWEHIGEMSAWQYSRKEIKEGETLEIFTDVESKVTKYKRVLAFLAFFVVILIAPLPNIWSDPPYSWSYSLWIILRVISLLAMGVFMYAIIKIMLRIGQLRKL
ncbi:MAG TPA: DUF2812 domain-containing protein [Dehalococcoidia bacterium]|nr:DUF2812 domain-containing protein [Dehalococcoidia bacterium]